MAAHSPLQQFEIKTLIPLPHVAGMDLSFTNAALFMFIAVAVSAGLILIGMKPKAVVPGRLQMLVESLHDMISNMVEQTAGHKSKPYFPFVFSLFVFIMFANMLGMIPYGFTPTSHIIVTFALAILVFLAVTVTGFVRHGFHFFSLFIPKGAPWWLAPFLFVVELISFCVRPLSLSVRLFANMMAGGILLKVFAGMIATMAIAGLFGEEGHSPSIMQLALAPLPFVLTVMLTGFKLFVAAIQAYIFSILTSVYLHDALELH
ncbi:MAG: F0F1 ATP synthase subunit A [Alphaproteobacteria bacterium]